MTQMIYCQKLQQESEALDRAPYPGEMGQRILQHISKQAWQMWIAHQTTLINEYQLDVLDPNARNFLREEMEKFLFGEGSNKPKGFTEK